MIGAQKNLGETLDFGRWVDFKKSCLFLYLLLVVRDDSIMRHFD